MKREQAMSFLSQSKQEPISQFGAPPLVLFGSTVRDTASNDIDVDILADFEGPATSKRYFGVQFFFEDLMACSVDLVTEKALRPTLRPYVERECIYV